jgi:hypothetical protein
VVTVLAGDKNGQAWHDILAELLDLLNLSRDFGGKGLLERLDGRVSIHEHAASSERWSSRTALLEE